MNGRSCEHLSIDTKRLSEILEAGSLPLVRIRKGNTLDELSIGVDWLRINVSLHCPITRLG